ncbi:SOS response-associated peptidase family protein [Marinilabilia salmonicolor]|uniref:SOS response-associated peptidase family protein n=1 Tax=Marinilabilia salmonicolor TaxID=989 RepID=UPI00029A5271|nr:SOS response-associated peptidase family protein [Marinilabilia salmonicolor]
MCFRTKNSKTFNQLEDRFKARFLTPEWYTPDVFNSFTFPVTPVITNDRNDVIQGFSWGLIPYWAKDANIRKSTLNARLETLDRKPSFKPSLLKQCLVLADGFYEWKWLNQSKNTCLPFRKKNLLPLRDFGTAGQILFNINNFEHIISEVA